MKVVHCPCGKDVEGETDDALVEKLFEDIGLRFRNRAGGYTRILKMGPRPGDSAPMALMQLVEGEAVAAPAPEEKPAKKKAKSAAAPKKAAKKTAARAEAAPKRRKKAAA